MITEIQRLFPAGALAPHGEPYINMENMLQQCLDTGKVPLYANRSLLRFASDNESKRSSDKIVVGWVKDIGTISITVDITNKTAYRLYTMHDLAIRIVSICTNSELEFGIRVQKILRLELELCRPAEEV